MFSKRGRREERKEGETVRTHRDALECRWLVLVPAPAHTRLTWMTGNFEQREKAGGPKGEDRTRGEGAERVEGRLPLS